MRAEELRHTMKRVNANTKRHFRLLKGCCIYVFLEVIAMPGKCLLAQPHLSVEMNKCNATTLTGFAEAWPVVIKLKFLQMQTRYHPLMLTG
jgi:hypothetical protein